MSYDTPPPSGQNPYGQDPREQGSAGQNPYGQNPYGQDQYGTQDPHGQQKRGSGMAIAALVLGILALLFCWTVVGGLLFGLIALVLGLVAMSRAKKGTGGGRVMAIVGVVLGVLGALISAGLIVASVMFFNSETGQNLRDCLEEAGSDQAAAEQCQVDFADGFGG